MSTIEYLKGLTRPPSSGSGVGLGQAYHEKGFIRLAFGLGFERCSGPQSSNCYGFSYSLVNDNSVTITERPAGSTGSGTVVWSSSWSSLDYDFLSISNNGKQTNGIWYLGKDQNIQQSDGLHEYSISVSAKDSHGGGNGASIYWIPSPAPPPGPIVTLRNKTGHFHSTGPVSIEIMAYPLEECSEGNASHVMISVDGGAWANANSFPVLETISGIGSHNIKVKGVTDEGVIGKPIDYSFSIGTNDWRPEVLTPIKTIKHEGETDVELGSGNNAGWVNIYSLSADYFTEEKFTPNVSIHECYANATTNAVVGEIQSSYSYTRTGSAIGTSSQSIGGWESFEIYPDKIVGEIALGSSTYDPDSISLRIVDKTDNTSYDHSFAPPNSPWFPDSFRQHGMGSHEVEIPYTFIDGHSYEMKMYGDHWTGSHYQSLISAGPEHNGIYAINNLSLSSGASFDVYYPTVQSDPANNYARFWTSDDPDQNTFVQFGQLVPPAAGSSSIRLGPMNYFQNTKVPPVDHEIGVFIGSFNGLKVYDECTIPNIVITTFDMASSPNANNEYEFTDSGLLLNVEVQRIDHMFPEQYYHVHYIDSDIHQYNALEPNVAKRVNILPADTETSVQVDIFNGCGDVVSKTFQLKYIGSGLGNIGQTTGAGPSSTVTNITTNTNVGSKPGYHSLIVNRIGD